jgi:hypothetical protein
LAIVLDLTQHQLRDEIAGDDEEDVDADEAAWNGGWKGVVKHDTRDGERAEPFDIGTEMPDARMVENASLISEARNISPPATVRR